MRKLIFITLLLALVSQLTWAQGQKLSTWQKEAVSLDDKVFDVTYERDPWVVRKVGADILVSRPKPSYVFPSGDALTIAKECLNPELADLNRIRIVKKVTDGFLISLNSGEGTGELWFVSKDGVVQDQLMFGYQIQRIFEFQSKLYAVYSRTGRVYSPGTGGILEITQNASGKWESKTLIKLAEAPQLIVVATHRIYLLTSEHLAFFNPDQTLKTVLRGPYKWGMLMPSSMVVDGPDVYLGTRWGVFKIKAFETQPEYAWYIPPSQ